MLSLRPTATKPRAVSQQKQKGSNAQRDHPQDDHDEEEDLIEQLNRKLSNVTLNPPSAIPDEMNLSDISTMVNCEAFTLISRGAKRTNARFLLQQQQ